VQSGVLARLQSTPSLTLPLAALNTLPLATRLQITPPTPLPIFHPLPCKLNHHAKRHTCTHPSIDQGRDSRAGGTRTLVQSRNLNSPTPCPVFYPFSSFPLFSTSTHSSPSFPAYIGLKYTFLSIYPGHSRYRTLSWFFLACLLASKFCHSLCRPAFPSLASFPCLIRTYSAFGLSFNIESASPFACLEHLLASWLSGLRHAAAVYSLSCLSLFPPPSIPQSFFSDSSISVIQAYPLHNIHSFTLTPVHLTVFPVLPNRAWSHTICFHSTTPDPQYQSAGIDLI